MRDQKLLEHANRLRTYQTPFEQKLWYALRAQRFDAARTRFLEGKGYQVMRFSNGDVGTNLDGVLTMIADALRSPLSPTLSPEGAREEKAA